MTDALMVQVVENLNETALVYLLAWM